MSTQNALKELEQYLPDYGTTPPQANKNAVIRVLNLMGNGKPHSSLFSGDIRDQYHRSDRLCSEVGTSPSKTRQGRIVAAKTAVDRLLKNQSRMTPEEVSAEALRLRDTIRDLRSKVLWCYMARVAVRNRFGQIDSGHEHQINMLADQLAVLNDMLARNVRLANEPGAKAVYTSAARVLRSKRIDIPKNVKTRFPMHPSVKAWTTSAILEPMEKHGLKPPPPPRSPPKTSPPKKSLPKKSTRRASPSRGRSPAAKRTRRASPRAASRGRSRGRSGGGTSQL